MTKIHILILVVIVVAVILFVSWRNNQPTVKREEIINACINDCGVRYGKTAPTEETIKGLQACDEECKTVYRN